MAKRPKRIKARNVLAIAVRGDPAFRPRIAKSDEEKREQGDRWSRKGKYKIAYPVMEPGEKF